ncbi:GntR family transcriptional regulator [Paenibacillus sp. 1011MAR3C5]|uniref:GntR family transcriptional regulator n=1 Tax=Paenibacillus sp. 1011MAR3C5 TaxID=1675787 RepID=UPI000E6BDAFF|nr:GntR family transcriptional regulator [Paenibacillus sp. 1011MAR3C5]RJE90332.1 GntR family transcriptional regulator [Paenibacillus sp. 1011MAR3C5]
MKSLPLYKRIQEDIRFLIRTGQLRPGDRVPSEKELAEQYHVSQITSKNAINGLAEEGILVRHRGKGTFVNANHEELPGMSRHKGFIGLILPSMKTKVDQRIMNAIEQYVRESGYYLLVKITQESPLEESRAIDDFMLLRVKGLIIFPIEQEMYNNDILRLSLNRFPLVLIDRYMKEIETYSVAADNLDGACRAVGHLLSKGHENIAFVTVKVTNSATADRAAGFEKAFLERNLPIHKNLWCTLGIEDIASGRSVSIIQEFLEDTPGITAVFTCNAELTGYTHRAMSAMSKPAGHKIELMSFDQSEWADVSYVKQNVEEMCRITIELLVEQINGTYNPRRVAVPVTLFHKNILNKI